MSADLHGKRTAHLQRLADQRLEDIVILKTEKAKLRERVAELEAELVVLRRKLEDQSTSATH